MYVDVLIDRAMRVARVNLAPGRYFAQPTSQKTEALGVLNDLMESLRLMSMTWYQITTNVHTLTINLNPHTLGTGGDLNQPRPVQIVEAYLRYLQSTPSTDTQLTQLTVQQYAEIAAKGIASQIPQYFYYDAGYSSNTDPKGNLYLWPVPNQANQIVLYTPVILTEPAALVTDLLLPPGYARMLIYNLAVELIPLYPKRINDPRGDAVIQKNAVESLYWVKVNNARPLDQKSDIAVRADQGLWDWRLGDYRWH